MLNFSDFIQVYVFSTNHYLKRQKCLVPSVQTDLYERHIAITISYRWCNGKLKALQALQDAPPLRLHQAK